MQHRNFKDAIYENLARIGKSVSCAPRIELLDLLCQGPRTVDALAALIDQTIGNTSQHLQVLKRAHLVKTKRDGTYITYFLSDPLVGDFIRRLRLLGEAQLSEMQVLMNQLENSHGGFQKISSDEFRKRLKAGDVTVIDVRPTEEFNAGHLAGAISLPLAKLESKLKELPKDQDVVAYCRGPYCLMAIDAVEFLRRKNIRAYRADMGVVDFRALNFEIESEGATL